MPATISCEEILNATSNGVVVTDAHGIIVRLNRQAERILDFSARQHVGVFICDVLPLTGPQVMECLNSGEPKLGHHIIGKRIDLVLNISLVKRGSRICGAVCNFQEMQEFENAARKLESYRSLNRQLNTIFSSSSDGIWVCDGRGKVISVNNASEVLNGIQAADIIGRNVSELMNEGLFDRSVTLEVLATKRQASVMQFIRRTGRHLLATGTPAFDEEGDVYLVVVNERDMTQLNTIREELEQTQQVTAKIKEELADLSLLELKEKEIVAESDAMRQVLRASLKLAHIGASNILILGESGTGKGLLAKFIHQASRRGTKPFIQINCAALPESLLEAELFGYERGAFTGAREGGKAGLFELAHEGTLFLDEIGDLPSSLQAKLLKYLDDHEVLRLGGTRPHRIDCTVIAATNRDLEALGHRQRFRWDLFYRLNSFTLRIPGLHRRPEDLFELTRLFLRKYNEQYGQQRRITAEGLAALQAHGFPGNVRELDNLIKKAVVMGEGQVLDSFLQRSLESASAVEHPGRGRRRRAGYSMAQELGELEGKILRDAMACCRSTRALAALLGVSQPTVVRKLKRHGLRFAASES